MSCTQEETIAINVHVTLPSYTKAVNVTPGLGVPDTRRQIRNATLDKKAPSLSTPVILSKTPKGCNGRNKSIGEFAGGSAMHALVPANPDLVNSALLRGELRDRVEEHRKDTEREVQKLLLTVKKTTVEAENHVKKMAALKQEVEEMKRKADAVMNVAL